MHTVASGGAVSNLGRVRPAEVRRWERPGDRGLEGGDAHNAAGHRNDARAALKLHIHGDRGRNEEGEEPPDPAGHRHDDIPRHRGIEPRGRVPREPRRANEDGEAEERLRHRGRLGLLLVPAAPPVVRRLR